MKKLLSIIVVLVLIIIVVKVVFYSQKAKENQTAPEVKTVEHPLIKVSTPIPNELVASPLKVSGIARGNWYFEASFPVRIYDSNGNELGVIPAQAQGEWMTTEFVPFEVMLPFTKPATVTGILVLEKDNPSGLPEHDDKYSIPVRFSL